MNLAFTFGGTPDSLNFVFYVVNPGKLFVMVSDPVTTATPLLNGVVVQQRIPAGGLDRKSTRLNSSHSQISYAVFCLKTKTDSSGSRTDVTPLPTNRAPSSTSHGRALPRARDRGRRRVPTSPAQPPPSSSAAAHAPRS